MARTTSFTFYHDVNLNMRTNDTFYFSDRSAQSTYFNSKIIATKSNLYYQRNYKGRVRVELPYSTLYRCDYLSFINPDFENKRFYCFVTGVNYIDNNTTEVHYVIDEVQTWLLDCTFARCFVERMHTIRDDYGANLLDDGLDCGLYQTVSMQEGILSDTLVVILSTFDLFHWAVGDSQQGIQPYTDKIAPPLQIKQGIYDELCQTAVYSNAAGYNALTGSALQNLLTHIYNGDGGVTMQDIVNIYIYPKIGLELDESNAETIGTQADTPLLNKIYRVGGANYSSGNPGEDITLPAVPATIAGFTPKNKKLLQYPFTVMHISNNDGSAIDLRFERFTDPVHPHAQVLGTSCGESKIRLTPKSYLGVTGNTLDFDTAIDSAPFPTVSMVGDSYLIYLAQNKNKINNGYNQMALNAGLSLAGVAASDIRSVASIYAGGQMGAFDSNPVKGNAQSGLPGLNAFDSTSGLKSLDQAAVNTFNNTFSQIQSLNSQLKDMAVAPATASGISGVGLAYQNGKKDFTISVKQIDEPHAKMIDDYYTMFGYPIRAIPPLNISNYIHARPGFNYIKTVGCIVRGNMPESAKATIESLFDSGIRFWLDRDHIGDFTINNDPIISNP